MARLAAGVAMLAALLVTVPPATGAVREPGWQVLGTWRQPQGLPQNTVYAILAARDGYIWLGSKGGVARFDGVRFTRFDDRNHDQLRDNEVWTLAEGDDGSLWFGTYGGGVSRLKDGAFTVYTTAEGLGHDYVAASCKDPRGAMWFGTDGGLSRLENGRFTNYTTAQGLLANVIRGVYCDADGSVWIGTVTGGVQRVVGGTVETPRLSGPTPTNEIRAFARTSDGALWITAFDGLFRVKDGTATRYTAADGLASSRVRALHPAGVDALWVISDRGLDHVRVAGGRLVVSNQMQALDLVAVTSDREGNLWVGSFIEGLVRLRQGLFASYVLDDGLADYYVASVFEDRNGGTWVGTRKGLSRFRDDGNTLVTFDERSGIPRCFALALTEDHDGFLWVGSDVGVFRSEQPTRAGEAGAATRFRRITREGLEPLYTRVFYPARDGTMWIGTDHQGLVRYQGGRLTQYTTRDGLGGNAVRALGEDRQGNLWVGTRGGGLCRMKGETFQCYSAKDGLAGDGVQSLHVDGDDTLWIGTRQGLSRLRDGRFTTYTVKDGLLTNFVYSFLDDGQDHLWMGSSQGIFRVARRELNDFADGKIGAIQSIAYGVEHGLRCTVAVVGSSPASFRSRDGRLWFGTNNGLSVLEPSRLKTNPLPPPVHIEEVRVDQVDYDARRAVVAPPGDGQVEIRYTGLSFAAPEKVKFKYRLDSFDKDWQDADTRRVAFYNLPPGRYRFHVRASNNDGVWNDTGAALDVTLKPRFHQTVWFYGLCVVGIALLGAATQRLRVARLESRERELAARVKEAVDQIDMLRGMLPICAACKKIRDDKGYWNQIETYIRKHSQAEFSHSICPDCMLRLYPTYVAGMKEKPPKDGE